jgi:hypothetical protein
MFFYGCDKKLGSLPVYKTGSSPVLTSSSTTLTPIATDSTTSVLKLTWTNPNFATDSATVQYILQIDSTGKNFANAVNDTIIAALWDTLTGAQLNYIAYNVYGIGLRTAGSLDVRLIASYANNDDEKISNTVTIAYTPYVIPPLVTPPPGGVLYMVGNYNGWNNSASPVPSAIYSKIDSVTYVGVFNLSGGSSYLPLPVAGSWGSKYGVLSSNASPTSGSFVYSPPNDPNSGSVNNIPEPATAGWYTVLLNFQSGKYTVTPFVGYPLGSLYITGGATPEGWTGTPDALQQFTQDNSCQYHISIALTSGGIAQDGTNSNGVNQYLLLPYNDGSFRKYAVNNDALANVWKSGTFGQELPGNFPAPPTDGTYTISVNFGTYTYTVQ